MFDNSVGKRLRALRDAAGKTQDELAFASGVNKQTISRIERGETKPEWASLVALARGLGVPVSELADASAEPGAVESRVERSAMYPSLAEFLATVPTVEDERAYLVRQEYGFGDPGNQQHWADLLRVYRAAKPQPDRPPLAPPTGADIRVMPVKKTGKKP